MTFRDVHTGGGCTALEHEKEHWSVWITDFDGSSAATESSAEINVCFFLNDESSKLFSIPALKELSEHETPGDSIGDDLYWSYRISLSGTTLEAVKDIIKHIPSNTFISKVVVGLNTPKGDETQ